MNAIIGWIRQRKLQVPTTILFESHRPMSFMLGQMLMAVEPLLPGMKTSRWGQMIGEWDTADPERMNSVIAELVSGDSAEAP